MIVVSDTSPLNYLVMVGCVDILPALFEQVHCPPEVIAELQHARASEGVRRWAGAPPVWLHITRARMPPVASGKLGPGELHAIAVAKELAVSHVLIDERDGAKYAQAQGLQVIGTLAVLEQAANIGLLELPKVLEKLGRTNFRVSAVLVRAALERDAARRARGG